ncbi:MAG: hypothetical protein JSR66_29820 [Proteobacteria bacterium]|nr:hypothetical protein [Pseudomonadota bacterium]
MKFRLKAFGFHVLASVCVLGLLLTILYFGWYQWPGWYLTGMWHITAILGGVDVTLGPLITLLIANPKKPSRELARDIGMIATVQLVALAYGAFTLWHGRPLYYAYSGDRVETIQASQLLPQEVELARQQNAQFAPHWYSRPRWVWAPMPKAPALQQQIIAARHSERGGDVTQMPRFYNSWQVGLPALRKQLKQIDQFYIFSRIDKDVLKQRMRAQGLPVDRPNTLFLSGSGKPLLLVFDERTLRLEAILRCN